MAAAAARLPAWQPATVRGTPVHKGSAMSFDGERAAEIAEFVGAHPRRPWLALDDIDLAGTDPAFVTHAVFLDGAQGLRQPDVDRGLSLLAAQQLPGA